VPRTQSNVTLGLGQVLFQRAPVHAATLS
jgi:hypothetical protein